MIQLRPSASHVWSGDTPCNAMPRFAAQLPEGPSSDPAREGTCAAWVAEMILTGEVENASAMVGVDHENGWIVEPEMAEHIQKYVDHLKSRGGEIRVERKVRLNDMIAGTPDAFTVVTRPDGSVDLFVDDLKYGYGVVEPYRNTQVSIYAGAIVKMMVPRGIVIHRVIIGIYQPRAYHPEGVYRTWQVWPEHLMEFVQKIERDGNDAQATDSRATPGFHCEYCPAASTCAALTHTVYKGHRVITDDRQGCLTADQLACELDFVDKMETLVKSRKSAIHAEAIARMKRSEFVPGYGFEYGFGRKKFTCDGMAIMAMTGITPYVDRKVCTPAELIRRSPPDRRKEVESIVDGITTRPRIPPKLVKFSADHFKRLFAQKDTE